MNGYPARRHSRLSEAVGIVFLILGLLVWLSLVSYHTDDPSLNTVAGSRLARNLIGVAGSYSADLAYQGFGALAFLLPVILILLAWKFIRCHPIEVPLARTAGWTLLVMSSCAAVALGPQWMLFRGAIPAAGVTGLVLSDWLISVFNLTGAAMVTATIFVLALYLASSFSLAHVAAALALPEKIAAPIAVWRERRRLAREEKQYEKQRAREEKRREREQQPPATAAREQVKRRREEEPRQETATPAVQIQEQTYSSVPPWDIPDQTQSGPPEPPPEPEIPIHTLDDVPPQPQYVPAPKGAGPMIVDLPPEPEPDNSPKLVAVHVPKQHHYDLPSTELLHEPQARTAYDQQELKDTAGRIKTKFEEFNVFGAVTQINPGPVVTTFEYKPDAGIKYNRITALSEDLCLGLQAESIMIERIPGKPTVGIEVPNTKREVISLRQILESEEFANSPSRLTIAIGKDINGRIKVSPLETMPHLLIAGSTGSGKSVMLNSLIMSILYKSTPDEVKMILIDPKRLEMGLYEGIPHLLTPVITDAKKATNALSNAVLEMERRLRLLAAQGVRNLDQYNKKVKSMKQSTMRLFEEKDSTVEELEPLPLILVLIDELADLMMVEGRNVEASITRLAQMARAVGMHLVVATQRPSVDVITGLIKANFPARISFRVATRVDSRTILDVMGADHLLGKGDMLFLLPGTSRLVRVHGAFVTETEINRVVGHWKAQAQPEYDQSFLVAPPSDDQGEGEPDADGGEEDPLYRDAVRVVLEVGKASTSTLQRRLRLGYGRAARILDMMQRDGIIGPPDGSRPREVLKRPDWLDEIDDQLQ